VPDNNGTRWKASHKRIWKRKTCVQRPIAAEQCAPATHRHELDTKENALTITAEMPGITKQDVKVEVEEGLVTIHAEREIKNIMQNFQLMVN
jgi:HSP20 family molecular chaperone IbpA